MGQELQFIISVDALEAARNIKEITKAFQDLGIKFAASGTKAQESLAAAGHSVRALATDMRKVEQESQMTFKSLVGVGLTVNSLWNLMRKIAQLQGHAVSAILELQAAQRLLNNSVDDGSKAFDWVKHKAYEYGLAVSLGKTQATKLEVAFSEAALL